MKKRLLVLGMMICMLGLTACGSSASDDTVYLSDTEALSCAEYYVALLGQMTAEDLETLEKQGYDVSAVKSGVESYESAMEEVGEITGMGELEQNTVDEDMTEGTILAVIEGTDHDAKIEIVFEKSSITSLSVNTIYSFAEGMEKAALNTLLGMGTVFVVLILISFIISCFSLIPKIQKAFRKKPAQEEIKSTAVDNTISQIVEKEETEDTELVAVIAAAIAASTGASSTDGFVVRSIRKHSRF